jgi:hypothetical protein
LFSFFFEDVYLGRVRYALFLADRGAFERFPKKQQNGLEQPAFDKAPWQRVTHPVGTETGCFDMPPYVTMVPPCSSARISVMHACAHRHVDSQRG